MSFNNTVEDSTRDKSLQKKLSIRVDDWDVMRVGKEMHGRKPEDASKLTKLELVSSVLCFNISKLKSPPSRQSLCSLLTLSRVSSRGPRNALAGKDGER